LHRGLGVHDGRSRSDESDGTTHCHGYDGGESIGQNHGARFWGGVLSMPLLAALLLLQAFLAADWRSLSVSMKALLGANAGQC
jgi:hypothetical protein